MSMKKTPAAPTLRPSDPAPPAPKLTLGQPLKVAALTVGKLADFDPGVQQRQKWAEHAAPDSASVAAAGALNDDAAPPPEPSEGAMARARRIAESYSKKSGSFLHPDPTVTEGVLLGLGRHIDELKRPLCPCRFYPDKQAEIEHRTWVCPCDDMQIYKYCHCLLFTNEQGLPITEHLPEDHEGRRIWGHVPDPDPSKGRALKDRAAEREEERRRRKS